MSRTPSPYRQSALTTPSVVPFLSAVLLACVTTLSHAQPELRFSRIVNNWPTIELYFTVACNGTVIPVPTRQYVDVYEEGLPVGDFTLWCPDPSFRCATSTGFVLDGSAAMSPVARQSAIALGHAFVDLMDAQDDQAAVLCFNDSAYVAQRMTASGEHLRRAINTLTAAGSTRLWDGVYRGLQEVAASGVNSCRALIVFAGGKDAGSARLPEQVIDLALQNRIRIFAVQYGTTYVDWLPTVAELTGGRHYSVVDPADVQGIAGDIHATMAAGFNECMITYQARCSDGTERLVDLEVSDFCGGTDMDRRSYVAARRTPVLTPVRMRLGSGSVRGNGTLRIPLELVDAVEAGWFPPATFSLLYDQSRGRITQARSDGMLLDSVPVTLTEFPGGVTVRITGRRLISGSGTLLEFTFQAGDPAPGDVLACPVTLDRWTFDSGCMKPEVEGALISIVPRAPDIRCSIDAPSALQWSPLLFDYTPNPFPVVMTVTNAGDREARAARYVISVDSTDLHLAAPAGASQAGDPADLAPARIVPVRWDVRARGRERGDSVRMCITASFDNHPDVTCCRMVFIPAGPPVTRAEHVPALSSFRIDCHPNPVRGELTVVSRAAEGPVAVTVSDVIGRVHARMVSHPGSGSGMRIDLRAAPPGVYLVSASSAGSVAVRRVVLVK